MANFTGNEGVGVVVKRDVGGIGMLVDNISFLALPMSLREAVLDGNNKVKDPGSFVCGCIPNITPEEEEILQGGYRRCGEEDVRADDGCNFTLNVRQSRSG